MTHILDDALVEKASRAFLEAARTVGEVENGVRDKRPYEALETSERDQLESCVRAALEAAGVAELRERIDVLTSYINEARVHLSDMVGEGYSQVNSADELLSAALIAALTNQGKAQG